MTVGLALVIFVLIAGIPLGVLVYASNASKKSLNTAAMHDFENAQAQWNHAGYPEIVTRVYRLRQTAEADNDRMRALGYEAVDEQVIPLRGKRDLGLWTIYVTTWRRNPAPPAI